MAASLRRCRGWRAMARAVVRRPIFRANRSICELFQSAQFRRRQCSCSQTSLMRVERAARPGGRHRPGSRADPSPTRRRSLQSAHSRAEPRAGTPRCRAPAPWARHCDREPRSGRRRDPRATALRDGQSCGQTQRLVVEGVAGVVAPAVARAQRRDGERRAGRRHSVGPVEDPAQRKPAGGRRSVAFALVRADPAPADGAGEAARAPAENARRPDDRGPRPPSRSRGSFPCAASIASRTGLKDRRWCAVGPRRASAARCSAVP